MMTVMTSKGLLGRGARLWRMASVRHCSVTAATTRRPRRPFLYGTIMVSVMDRVGTTVTTRSFTTHVIGPSQHRDHSITSNTSTTTAVPVNHANIGEVLSKYDTLLLDCDGVLWANDHFTKFTGIPESIDKLRGLGKQLYFVTNNSLHAREAYLEKFRDFAGFEAEREHVFGVAYAAALYLRDVAKIQGKCYLIGTVGMARELESVGIPYFGLGPDLEETSIKPDDLMAMQLDPEVDAVLVGFDETFSYNKLFKAASYLSNPKCHYIATNDLEKALQLSDRHRQPLTGALIPAITAATSREPVVIGKPSCHLLQCIQSQVADLDLSRTLMIGDSIKTDIGFAHTIGVDSLLVLTGSTSKEQLQKYELHQNNVPTYYLDSFSNFGRYI